MSITTKCALGIAVALFAFGSACTDAKQEEAGTAASQSGSQTTQPATDVRQLAQQPLVTNLSESELARFFSSMPDGRGLPEGSGTVKQGEKVYAAQCASCHGGKLEGGIGDKLIGGRGSLAAKDGKQAPVKTMESYWPYATTLWDYIKRAMPFSAPGSLSNDDAYAVTAYILNQAQIVPDDATMNKSTLPKVEMPNRNGFRDAGR
jgi:S-disulfanyl-L-cysteine oxidoreductase SoxD